MKKEDKKKDNPPIEGGTKAGEFNKKLLPYSPGWGKPVEQLDEEGKVYRLNCDGYYK